MADRECVANGPLLTRSENVLWSIKALLYLDSQKLAWDRVPETQQKQPDYRVEHNGEPCLFEVRSSVIRQLKPIGGFSACPAIQEKFTQARKQFKKYRNCCCAVVLWNSKSIYRTVLLDTVASAAFGKYVTVDAGPAKDLRADPRAFNILLRLNLAKTKIQLSARL